MARFLGTVANLKHRVILTVCNATGLRISEAVRLRPTAIDSKRMVIRVEQGKGRKDRYVMLPPKFLDILRDYWQRTHPGQWLFPSRLPGQPVCPLTIKSDLPGGGAALRHRQTGGPAFAASRLRCPSSGSRHRSAHHPVTARSSQSEHHGSVSHDRHQHGLRHSQSVLAPSGPDLVPA